MFMDMFVYNKQERLLEYEECYIFMRMNVIEDIQKGFSVEKSVKKNEIGDK